MTQCFIIVGNEQKGPYTLVQLQDLHIGQETLVWSAGLDKWTPAWEVEELKPLFKLSSASTVPPPIPPQTEQTTQEKTTQAETEKPTKAVTIVEAKKQSRWGSIVFVAIAIILGILAITNPSREDHNEAIQKAVKEVIDDQQTNNDDDIFSQGMSIISGFITKHVTAAIVDKMLDVDNYGLFSIGSIRLDGKSHTVSYGVLGHVYTFDKSDIQKALKKNGIPSEDSIGDSNDNTEDLQSL
ncbi:GYF domain-containing protein [Prevotella sp. DNF00663]|uniref:GYF domain-containing protein n=1 Tax=Prevotella sp. DNF00663 TaxID=1384078 RepID=UPI000A64AB13|nr:GYF domain-containing protein [Prevotella sp. DNF00663]